MTDCHNFMKAADDTTAQWTGMVRTADPNPDHAQLGLVISNDEDFQDRGVTLVAMASGDAQLGHVAISVHAFADGRRVEPTVMVLGDEVIITLADNNA